MRERLVRRRGERAAQRAGGIEALSHVATSACSVAVGVLPEPAHGAAVAAVLEQAGPAFNGLLAPVGLAPACGVDHVEPLEAERPLRARGLLVAERGAQHAEARDQLVDGVEAGVAVGGEDLRPQAGVGARHARHVAERGAGQRGLEAALGREPGERLRGQVRHVARARDRRVVLLGRAGDDPAAERVDRLREREQRLERSAGRAGRPGRALQQHRRRGGPARGLRARHRVGADEPLVRGQPRLHRGGVGDERGGQRLEHLPHDVGAAGGRHGHEHELAAVEARDVGGDLEALAGGRLAHGGVGVVARAAERAQQGAADQPEPDDAGLHASTCSSIRS